MGFLNKQESSVKLIEAIRTVSKRKLDISNAVELTRAAVQCLLENG